MTRTALYTKHQSIAAAIARDYFLPGQDRDDVAQEARVALWEATGVWDRERGPFPSFARMVVRRRLQDAVTKARRPGRCLLTDSYRDLETVAVTDPVEHRRELRELVAAVGLLNDAERATLARIVNEVPIDGKTDDTQRYRLRKKLAA